MGYKVQKWGNSNGIRIPKVFLEALNLKSGDSVSMVREEDKIIIKKIAKIMKVLMSVKTLLGTKQRGKSYGKLHTARKRYSIH